MLCWHSILPFQTKWNLVEHYPMVWSIRKRSRASDSKNSLETLLLPIPIAVLRYVLAFHTHSYWDHWVIFDDFLLGEQRWNANLAQSRSRNPMSQLSTGVCQVCLITELVENSCFFFRIFHSWVTEIEIDTLDAYPKEDLWSWLFVRVG